MLAVNVDPALIELRHRKRARDEQERCPERGCVVAPRHWPNWRSATSPQDRSRRCGGQPRGQLRRRDLRGSRPHTGPGVLPSPAAERRTVADAGVLRDRLPHEAARSDPVRHGRRPTRTQAVAVPVDRPYGRVQPHRYRAARLRDDRPRRTGDACIRPVARRGLRRRGVRNRVRLPRRVRAPDASRLRQLQPAGHHDGGHATRLRCRDTERFPLG